MTTNDNVLFEIEDILLDKINKICPNIDLNTIEQDLLKNIIDNIITEEQKENKITEHKENAIIEQNYLMAYDLIPEMSFKTNLILMKGKINNSPLTFMIDTGSAVNVMSKSCVSMCGLEYLIDTKTTMNMVGVNSVKKTIGTIWFLEIELDMSNGNEQYVSIPITVNVNDDSEITDKNVKHYFDIILGKLIFLNHIVQTLISKQ